MNIRTHIPHPPLSDFVEMFWLFEGHTQAVKERALPTATVELIIDLRQDSLRVFNRQHPNRVQSFRGAMICGPHSEFFVIDAARDEAVLGVHFKPGGAFPFLKLPLGELHNAHVSLETLWSAHATTLREQLLEAKTPKDKFHRLEQFLQAQISRTLAQHPAVAFALQEFQHVPHMRTIGEVTHQIGLSQRHFINDFQAFCGLNPTAYLIQRGKRNPNHVPINN